VFLQSNIHRIQKDIETMAQYTATPGCGITRFSFTAEDRLTREYIKARMRECALTVHEDAAGTVIGRRAGKRATAPVVMIGSHFDSVNNGGPFDGPAGVVTALEIASVFHENQVVTEYPLEFVALIEEEGGRFGGGLFGSRAMAGKITPEEMRTCKDAEGISMAEAMATFGFDPVKIQAAVRKPEQLKAFLELHIEQGPILEATGISVGIVETVVGIEQLEITINGRPDHAGTTPMAMRADALVAAADIIKLVNHLAKTAGAGTVATIGRMSVVPGAANIVPGRVVFTVDLRAVDAATIESVSAAIQLAVAALPRENHGITGAVVRKLRVDPVHLSPQIHAILAAAGRARGISTNLMRSGAGHDAMVMAGLTQVGLVFVPSRDGRSHCPEEWTDYAQLQQGIDLVLGAVLRLAEAQ
jgi:allantoate deiminase